MDKFKNKYRVKSARLQDWDYGSNAGYFVTVCVADRACHFGDVLNGKMQLSALGLWAEKCWLEIPDHFPFVVLDGFVAMPNHVHGILFIDKPVETQNVVETQNIASLPGNRNAFGPQSQNLASIIRGYKIGVTKYAKSNQLNFAWQPRFHEHVIRNQESYLRITEYIQNNPLQWQLDKYYV
jgi:REP element-mobilizing transposase RayT